jgi:hypothetical protein
MKIAWLLVFMAVATLWTDTQSVTFQVSCQSASCGQDVVIEYADEADPGAVSTQLHLYIEAHRPVVLTEQTLLFTVPK